MSSDVLITPSSGLIQFSSSAGTGSGQIKVDGDNLVIELKSRRINHNKYDTLFFGKNKFDKGLCYQSEGVRVYFVFNCLDGIYYWEMNENECFHKKGGRFDRGRPEVQMLTNVKIEFLKKV